MFHTASHDIQRALRRGLLAPCLVVSMATVPMTMGCGRGVGETAEERGEEATEAKEATTTADAPWLEDVTADSGIDFVHDSGFDGSFYMPEIMGGGLALFDADGDGDLDLYLVDGGDRRADGSTSADNENVGGRLYANRGDGTFEDVSAGSGLGHSGYGMGCAVGDVEGDGDLDLYVTTVGRDVFYRNRGDGTFEQATDEAGLRPSEGPGEANEGWSTSAGFFDAEGDGDLDLYVVRYVVYSARQQCTTLAGQPEYCGPQAFPGTTDRLFLNRGDGTFEDATTASGVARIAGRGLGLALLDLDDDGAIEIFVANDGEPNQLWDLQGLDAEGRPRYDDRAVPFGVAVDLKGRSEASMGVATGDVDGDGDLDLLATHLEQETNTLYLNAEGRGFEDRSAGSGLGLPSLPTTGFGTSFFDADLDGDLDLLVANGKVRLEAGASQRTADGDPSEHGVVGGGAGGEGAPLDDATTRRILAPYAEPHHVYENLGGGRFDLRIEPALETPGIGRGLALGDLDGDGDLDAVLAQIHAPPRVLRNIAPRRGHWLALRVLDTEGRTAVGARVEIHVGGRRHVRHVSHTDSYLTARDATVHLGLGESESVERIEVRWPGSTPPSTAAGRESFGPFGVDRTVVLQRHRGTEP